LRILTKKINKKENQIMVRKTTDGMSDWFGWFPLSIFCDETCFFVPGMGNTCVFETDEGLVIFDVPIKQYAQKTFKETRQLTEKPVKYIIYSHGHFDHAFGYGPFIEEIKKKGWEMPEVIGHENCIKRFEKYRTLDKYHEWINKQQFASVRGKEQKSLVSAHETLDPTIILRGNEDSYSFKLGKVNFEIYHDKGETDDSIWLWVPEKKTICAGDLMVSSFPNVGNPYKVQRYPKDWAIAMERMREKNAEYLVPGHGKLIEGKVKVKNVLSITAEVMHFVHDEVVKRLNEGKWFYRLYHGWYNSGNPTNLFPAKTDDIAREFLRLNSEEKYLEHANKLFSEGKKQLALHVLDIVVKGTDEKNVEHLVEALKLKVKILKEKVQDETSFIAGNIIDNAAYQIKERLKELKKKNK
jgi:glyoxylase-like metal-dependent hydrolase (beta-lactamase superfamily II)